MTVSLRRDDRPAVYAALRRLLFLVPAERIHGLAFAALRGAAAAAPVRRRLSGRLAPIVVTDVCPRSNTATIFPCAARESTCALTLVRLAWVAPGDSVYSVPSALPSTTAPSERRVIAVKSTPLEAVEAESML